MPIDAPASALAVLDRLLDRLPTGVAADARLEAGTYATIRFANSWIHQPTRDRAATVSLRVWRDERLGTATSSDLSRPGLDALVRAATSLARVAPKDPKFPGFSRGSGGSVPPTPFDRATGRLAPDRLTARAHAAIDGAHEVVASGRVFGVLNQGVETLAVANTSGLRRATRRSMTHASVLVDRVDLDPPVSGWSEGAHLAERGLDPKQLGREAAERMPSRPPEAVPPGPYRVLLDGPAFGEAMSFLGYLGFGGRAADDGYSCLAGKRGRAVGADELELVDDGRAPESLPSAIDYEGTPKRRRALLHRGVAGPPVTDLVTAGHLGMKPTGHALPPESPSGEIGAIPTNLIVRPGRATWDELVQSVRRGLLVTRFHYVRVVHPAKGVITGMTRDGTYWIERGAIVRPVRNLRFTESVLAIARGVELLGRTTRCYSEERGGSAVTTPAAVVRRVNFTSATLF
ncbi:MAG TPA: TldD/PmbA family protein [Thermoplasmata archaeon]|nr:TldD/PmbA family protein [Thermoplasmata archaeon]